MQSKPTVSSSPPGSPAPAGAKPTTSGHVASPKPTGLQLYTLRPKDANEPPFHFTGTVQLYVVAAASEKDARHIAAGDAGQHGAAWEDKALSECVLLAPDKPGLVARDMGI
jgi:hypothetical protein